MTQALFDQRCKQTQGSWLQEVCLLAIARLSLHYLGRATACSLLVLTGKHSRHCYIDICSV